MNKKRKFKDQKRSNDSEYDPPSFLATVKHIKLQEKRLIVILEGAQLETVKVNDIY